MSMAMEEFIDKYFWYGTIDYSCNLIDEETILVPNKLFRFVPVAFLNGCINYIDILSIYLVSEEAINIEDLDSNFKTNDLSAFGGDLVILGESSGYFWYMFFDFAKEDSCIGRMDKDYLEEELISEFSIYCKELNQNYYEIPVQWLSNDLYY